VTQLPTEGPQILQHLCSHLRNQSLVWGGLWARSIVSTNRLACELAAARAPEGLLIGAEFQEAGQGQHGRQWYCAPGQGLLCSLILHPSFLGPQESFLITQWAAVSIAQALAEFTQSDIRLKWPNDIIWQHRKLGGILTQASLTRSPRAWAVTGWGINVNQQAADWPAELRNSAISIRAISEAACDRAILLAAIIQAMDRNWELLSSGDHALLSHAWLELTDVLERRVTVHHGEQDYHGKVSDVTDKGQLIVTLESGQSQVFLSGEITDLQ
jgi:BirA family biotin operon repressor/biotin-[acetyl-CoA-carboxylase] ligase